MNSGLARSVQTRLVRHAHAHDLDPNLVLSRYATERHWPAGGPWQPSADPDAGGEGDV